MRVLGKTDDDGVIVALTKKEWERMNKGVALQFDGLCARLRAYRANYGLSLRDVQEITGVNFATLCRIEQGRDIMASTAQKVVKMLDEYTPCRLVPKS